MIIAARIECVNEFCGEQRTMVRQVIEAEAAKRHI